MDRVFFPVSKVKSPSDNVIFVDEEGDRIVVSDAIGLVPDKYFGHEHGERHLRRIAAEKFAGEESGKLRCNVVISYR